jgi:hypothetical protein
VDGWYVWAVVLFGAPFVLQPLIEGLVMWREARGLERALREREDCRNG